MLPLAASRELSLFVCVQVQRESITRSHHALTLARSFSSLTFSHTLSLKYRVSVNARLVRHCSVNDTPIPLGTGACFGGTQPPCDSQWRPTLAELTCI